MKLKLISIDERELKIYLVQIGKTKDFSAQQVEVLVKKLDKAKTKEEKDDARMHLVQSQLKNVVHIANNYRGAGLTLAWLIAAGNKALVQAVGNYSHSEPEDFSQYAAWKVEGAIIEAILEAKKG